MQNLLTVFTTFFGCICFAAFAWGIKGHFRSTGAVPSGMKLTATLSAAGFVWFIWRLTSGVASGWPMAVLLFAGALAMFGWSIRATWRTPPTLAFDNDAPSFLLHHGPYRYVRHPFYLAYLLFWVGTAAATHGLLGWIVPVLAVALYFHAAAREEQKFAKSGLNEAYASYREQAGMFFPRTRL